MPSPSKNKGSAFEREIAAILNTAYNTTEFGRAPGSGAFNGGKNRSSARSAHAIETLTGDLTTPLDFPYSIECKCYSATNGPNPYNLISGSDRTMDMWLEQACSDAEAKRKIPMLFFKLTPKKGTWFVVPSAYGSTLPCTRYVFNDREYYIFRIQYLNELTPYMA